MKKILAVYDVDEEYGKHLAEYLNRREWSPFSIVCFTNEESLVEFGKEHRIDMLLIQETAYSDVIRNLEVHDVIYLTEKKHKAETEKGAFIYKFQSSDQMVHEIMSCYQVKEPVPVEVEKPGCQVTAAMVYSPVSRCLKTSFALTLCQVLSRNRRVLYLNFEDFSGLQTLFGRSFQTDISEALFYYKQGVLSERLEELVENWHNFDYLPPARYPEDLDCAGIEDISGMIGEIILCGRYDILIIDCGTRMLLAEQLFPFCDRIYIPIREDMISRGKLAAFDEWIARKRPDDVERLEKIRLPLQRGIGRGEMHLDQLLWGEFGDYVRSIVKGGW